MKGRPYPSINAPHVKVSSMYAKKLHCCSLSSREAAEWRKSFPHVYFGFSSSVGFFGSTQKAALKEVPANRLLVETDSPHLSPLKEVKVATPVYVGDVAALVAEIREEPVNVVLETTRVNALVLYGQ